MREKFYFDLKEFYSWWEGKKFQKEDIRIKHLAKWVKCSEKYIQEKYAKKNNVSKDEHGKEYIWNDEELKKFEAWINRMYINAEFKKYISIEKAADKIVKENNVKRGIKKAKEKAITNLKIWAKLKGIDFHKEGKHIIYHWTEKIINKAINDDEYDFYMAIRK